MQARALSKPHRQEDDLQMTRFATRRQTALSVLASLSLLGPALGRQPAVTRFDEPQSLTKWGGSVWEAARNGSHTRLNELLRAAPAGLDETLVASIESYRAHIDNRETTRIDERKEAIESLREILREPVITDAHLSEGLVHATNLEQISLDPSQVFLNPQVKDIVRKAEIAARMAENRADWLIANELFYRLHTLFMDRGGAESIRYKGDLDRLNRRLSMIQFYAPRELWRLRNEREIADGNDPLPEYLAFGETYAERLEGISQRMVDSALKEAATGHVERVDVRKMILKGLEAIEVMLTTPELQEGMPALARQIARERFLADVARERRRVKNHAVVTPSMAYQTLRELLRNNKESGLRLMDEVIMHEFTNGAFSNLDEFSGVIWPDELRRFERNTNGNYKGIGIQIQMNESRAIQVVTPLDDTPAYRADVRAGDVIRTVDGKPTAGLSLNQVSDVITGTKSKSVVLGIKRKDASDPDAEPELLDIEVQLDTIIVKTVKGWQRETASDWDWFIDPDRNIGYVRLTQFTGSTTRELRQALREMDRDGLNGLILDLRFNPGGLLDQSVSVANLFIPGGTIVSTQDGDGNRDPRPRNATSRGQRVEGSPVVVLVNQSSASASEIVSGALQDHAQNGNVDAIILGRTTYGKGSVQNVWALPGDRGYIKLTKRYYVLPKGRLIHKRPGAFDWGVRPNLEVTMLPSQTLVSVLLRRDADMLPLVGEEVAKETADPSELIEGGLDLQLETALLLLRARTAAQSLSTT